MYTVPLTVFPESEVGLERVEDVLVSSVYVATALFTVTLTLAVV